MIIEALEKVLAGEDLSRAEAETAMEEVFSRRASEVQSFAFLAALHMKGMTKEEKAAFDEAAKRHPDDAGRSCSVGVELSATGYQYLVMSKMLVIQGQDLSRREAENAMEDMLSGRAPAIEIAQFLAALRFKGETVDELVGFATAMRRHATPIFAPGQRAPEPLVDTCGTGGDACGTFNVSTAAAFVVAGAGVHVAKHGNRSISSHCGSADVLEELGVRIDLPPDRVGRAIEEIGIGFLFAPAVHAATRHAMPVRRELKVRTVFNLLGPLTNPAGASAQVAGVYDASFTELMAKALGELGVRRAFVVHGADGLDEISLSGETSVAELRDGVVRSYTVVPEDFGLPRAPLEAIRGGDVKDNAKIIHRVFGRPGHAHEHGSHRDIVLANSAGALVAAGRAKDFLEGVRCAAESIDSGAARARLEALIAFSQSEPAHGHTQSAS
jgi:anthranilate phosphoribosyltransferase